MPTPSSAGSDDTLVNRPNATSALGFLTRGIRSVSNFVSGITTIFVSSASASESSTLESDDTEATHGEAQTSDEDQTRYGSSSDDGPHDDAPRTLGHTDEDTQVSSSQEDMPAPATRSDDAFQPRLIPGSPYVRHARAAALASSSRFGQGPSTSAGASGSAPHNDFPPRLNGAIHGYAPPAPPPAAQPRRRGQLRREPVWIDGQDPGLLNPASELRGADPRALPENRYWRDAWGPLPTLADLDGPSNASPSVTRVLEWLQGRYNAGSEPYFQALNHIFPLPGTSETLHELRPHFERILQTSLWRAQGDDWQGGIEPVDRVREPARADDAADSEADVESIGYISDRDSPSSSEEASSSASTRPGSSSTALASSTRPFALLPAPPTSSASRYAEPFTAGPSRWRKRTRDSDSDAEHSTTTSPDEERPATRCRLNPPASSSSTARRRGVRPSLPVSSTRPRRPAWGNIAPRNSPDVPAIVYTPPSPQEADDALVSPELVAGPSSGAAEPSSSQLLAPPPRQSPRHSRRLARAQTPAPVLTPALQPESSAAPSGSSSGVLHQEKPHMPNMPMLEEH
ncbi:hypothetical protein GY45DRAFT_1341490 [Cubamyces sp. BRFM 1775]|nr:hypothetical protein GY45DRAFT_1341490 [Cubamyces sp. BRFM 1775]